MPVGARKGFDQHLVRRRDDGAELLDADPVGDLIRQAVPVLFIMKEFAHTVCQEGGEREFAACIIGDGGFRIVRTGGDDVGFGHAFKAEDFAAEEEGIARRERFHEAFLDLTEDAAGSAAC